MQRAWGLGSATAAARPSWTLFGEGQESSAGPLADSRRIMAEVVAWM